MPIWNVENPQLTGSVEVPFSGKPQLYWARPTERSELEGASYWNQLGKLGIGLAALTGIYYSPRLIGRHPGNTWFKMARNIEEFASPYGILSTFRVSEALSTARIVPSEVSINISNLTSRQRYATGSYLRHIMGWDVDMASMRTLEFLPSTQSPIGEWYARDFKGERKLLGRGRSMRPGRLFESFTSVVQPGLYSEVHTSRAILGGIENTRHVPIPSKGKFADFVMGVRSYLAFGTQRLGELMERVGEEIKIPYTQYSIKSLIEKVGVRTSVKRGSATRTLFAYAGLSTAVGLGISAIQQIDAFRNATNLPMRLAGLGMTGAAGYILGKGVARGLGISQKRGGRIGLAAAGISQLIGFDQGIIPGAGGLVAKANLLRSAVGEATGLNALRRWTERTFPGSTGVGTAAYMGLLGGIAGYVYARHIVPGEKIPPLFRRLFRSQGSIYAAVRERQLQEFGKPIPEAVQTATSQMKPAHTSIIKDVLDKMVQDNAPLFSSDEAYEAANVARRVQGSIHKKHAKAITSGNLFRRVWQRLYVGAKLGKLSSIFQPALLIGGIWGLNSLGTMETPEELSKIYSGEQLVPVRRGRYWEGGRSPYEGGDILYWRQHWLPRLQASARVRGKDPIRIPFIEENFGYDIERENYYRRPYPITSAAFDEVPFVSTLLRPLGDLIKPPRLMHVSDWARVDQEGNIQLRYFDSALTPAPSAELGGLAPAAPVSPYGLRQSIQRQFYETAELMGLVGWASGSIYAGITDSQMPFDQDLVMRSATLIESRRRNFWSEQSGGALFGIPFMSEAVRRFLPAYPSIVQHYNPIVSDMEEWLPLDLRIGDPYTSLLYGLGEERLPGPMYEELYGATPGDYSLPHRLRILADTAYWSPEYRNLSRTAQAYTYTEDPDSILKQDINMTLSNLELKKQKIPLDYYRTMSSGYGFYDSEGQLHDVNEDIKAKGLIASMLGKPWEKFIHGVGQITSPVEHIIPAGFSPWAKLVSMYDPVEHYEMNKVYGQQYKFWSNPWANWFRPAVTSAKRYWFGDESIPDHIQEIRDVQEYYDKLKWLKYQRLAVAARAQNREGLAGQYERVARSTAFGANPFGGESQLKYALNYSDRSYFDPFSMAQTDEVRSNIMRLIPHHHREIYQGIWANRLYNALRRQQAHGTINSAGEEQLAQIEQLRMTQGKPYNEDLWADYIDKAPDGMSYPDWHRMKEAEAFFTTHPLPNPSWIGWNPAVDLEDVKLKQIQEQGKDYHNYDIFQSRVSVLNRKPYLEENYQPHNQEYNYRLENQMDSTGYNRMIRRLLMSRGLGNSTQMNYNFLSPSRSTSSINIDAHVDTSLPLGYLLQ